MKAASVCLCLLIASTTIVAKAACIFPVPDSDTPKPSPANLHGKIDSIQGELVKIISANTKKIVTVRVPRDQSIFTVFGGDDSISTLRTGQTVWVWYEGCKKINNGIPVSAYFQIFSTDPNDKPPSNTKSH